MSIGNVRVRCIFWICDGSYKAAMIPLVLVAVCVYMEACSNLAKHCERWHDMKVMTAGYIRLYRGGK